MSRRCGHIGARRTAVLVAFAGATIAPALPSPAEAAASIVLREQHPVEGESVELYIQDDAGAGVSGAEVSVTYRPGSSVEQTEVVGTTNESGRLMWTPSTAGIAAVTASWGDHSASINVSVKFSSAPWLGIVIMILAGLLLVGGSFVRIGRVLSSAD